MHEAQAYLRLIVRSLQPMQLHALRLEEVVVDSQGYGRARNSENRDDRKMAFDAFWSKWAEYRNSVGMVMNSHLQTQVALAKARNYDSVLERELFQDNLPPAVYRTLVSEVNKAKPSKEAAESAGKLFDRFERVLGCFGELAAEGGVDAELQGLLDQRQAARKDKDFGKADAMRDELQARGWKIVDGPEGLVPRHARISCR